LRRRLYPQRESQLHPEEPFREFWEGIMTNSMSEAVRVALDRYAMDTEFGLWDLKREVLKLYPPSKFNHADTISRRLRERRIGNGYEIICINPNKSRYKKVKYEPKRKRA
jgi:hypothetical protein